MKNIAIIGCTKRKKNYKCKAVELYQASSFFCKELQYAKEVLKADDIYILSAKHHLIHSSTIIEPYNVTLLNMSKKERLEWSKIVLNQITETFNPSEDKLYILCGEKYYEFLESELIEKDYEYKIPLKGVGGIGKQLHWLDEETEKTKKINLFDIIF